MRKLLVFVLLALALVSVSSIPIFAQTIQTTTIATKRLSFSEDWLNGVVIVVYGNQYGTGFWINSQYIATAAHVVNFNPSAVVTIIRGSVRSQGRVVALDRQTDVAIIYVQNADRFTNKHIFPLARWMPPPTSTIYVIGYPAELLQVLGSLEALSEHPRVLESHLTWASNGLIELGGITDAGNSGGPVVDASGAVIGIVSFALRGEAGTLYFATSVANLKRLCRGHHIAYIEQNSFAALPAALENNPAAVAAVTATAVNLVEDIAFLALGAAIGGAILAHRRRARKRG